MNKQMTMCAAVLVVLLLKFVFDVVYLFIEADIRAKCSGDEPTANSGGDEEDAAVEHGQYARQTPSAHLRAAHDPVDESLVAPSQCPRDIVWFRKWVEATIINGGDLRRTRLLVDVGANKGYTLALWTHVLSAKPLSIFSDLALLSIQNGIRLFCGNCCDCAEPLLAAASFENVTQALGRMRARGGAGPTRRGLELRSSASRAFRATPGRSWATLVQRTSATSR